MAEYIDRNTAIAKVTALEVIEPLSTMVDVRRLLADMPAADVTPVVRCNVCVNYNTYNCSSDFGWCENLGIGVHDSFFCKVGERKEGDE